MRHCFVVRVFTRGDEGGNHLGIVTDVVGLTDGTMQRIASELGFSETIFIDSTAAGSPHVRIFTPAMELPFAGHPLVGAAWLLNTLAPEPQPLLTCGIGEVVLEWDGERAWIDVALDQETVQRPDFEPGQLGLSGVVAVHEVRMPLTYVVAELESPEVVGAFVPDGPTLSAHPDGQHLSIWSRKGPSAAKTRFFAPKLGILEDPATGSAAVAIAATLRHQGAAAGALTLEQGEEVGFPSVIALRWDGDRARLGGTVVQDGVRELEL